MSRLSLLLVGLFVLFFTNKLSAKNDITYADAGLWSTINLDYALNKKWAILFAEEFRMRENYSRLNLFYTNLGMEYQVNKYVKTSLVYRNIQRLNLDNSFTIRHRLMWDASFKYRFQKWYATYRHRLQVEYRGYYSQPTGKVPEWYSRHKFELGYQVKKKITAYAAAEFRYQIFDPRNLESEDTWHRARFQGGVDYRLNKFSKVGAYYLVQRVFNVSNLEHIYITGIEYSASLSDAKFFKKKK